MGNCARSLRSMHGVVDVGEIAGGRVWIGMVEIVQRLGIGRNGIVEKRFREIGVGQHCVARSMTVEIA